MRHIRTGRERLVVILSGIMGCGKTVVAQHYKLHEPNVLVVSADNYFAASAPDQYVFKAEDLGMAHAACLLRFVDELRTKPLETIVVDNTNIGIEEIAPYYALAEAYGWTPIVAEFLPARASSTDLSVAGFCGFAERCKARNKHSVPDHTFARRAEQFRSRILPRRWRRIEVYEDNVAEIIGAF